MSPKGEKAPPAFAATTMFIQASNINLLFPFPTAITTAHISKAVVRLSAIGDIKNDRIPVITNIFLKSNIPLLLGRKLTLFHIFLIISF